VLGLLEDLGSVQYILDLLLVTGNVLLQLLKNTHIKSKSYQIKIKSTAMQFEFLAHIAEPSAGDWQCPAPIAENQIKSNQPACNLNFSLI
jgi:hypothetical protein